MSKLLHRVGKTSQPQPKHGAVISDKELEEHPQRSSEGRYHNGIGTRFPRIGLAALAIVFGCIASVIAILVTSDGKAQEQWPQHMDWVWTDGRWRRRAQITPSVTLAIMNTISNICLAVAIGQAIAMSWRNSLLRGTTSDHLRKDWSFSASLLQVLTAGNKFAIIALAALVAKFALIDNLLLQRAAGTKPGFYERPNAQINMPFYNELPAGYAGVSNSDGSTSSISDAFASDLYRYSASADQIRFNDTWAFRWDANAQTSQSTFDTRCVGICTTSIPAFGFSVNCSEPRTSATYDVTSAAVLASTNSSQGSSSSTTNFSRTLLNVNSTLLAPNEILHGFGDAPATFNTGTIVVSVRYARNTPSSGNPSDLAATSCTAHQVQRICVLQPAVLAYPVEITNNTGSGITNGIRIASASAVDLTGRNTTSTDLPFEGGQIPGVTVLHPAFVPYDSSSNANMQAIVNMMQSLFATTVNLDYTNGQNGGYVATSASSNPLSLWWGGASANRANRQSCMINMFDPLPWIVSQLNSIMLRASIAATVDHDTSSSNYMQINAAQIKTKIAATNLVDTVIYHSDYGFMAGAIVTMLFCAFCALPSYYHLWKVGRKAPLGSMEIASVFQAPFWAGQSRGHDANVLLKEVGSRKLDFGEADGQSGAASPDGVTKPSKAQTSTLRSGSWHPLRSKESLL